MLSFSVGCGRVTSPAHEYLLCKAGSVLVDDGANLLEQIPRGLLDDGLGAVDEIDRFRVFHASVRVDRIVGFRPPEHRKQKDVVFHVIGDSGAQLGVGERDDRRIIRFLFRFIMDAADFCRSQTHTG